jgi:outer membrane protein insertion porin family
VVRAGAEPRLPATQSTRYGVGRQGKLLETIIRQRQWLDRLPCVAVVVVLLLGATARAVDELDFGLAEHRLARLEISGNAAFSESELKRILGLEEPDWRHPLRVANYRPDLVESRLRLLRSYYRLNGYHAGDAVLDSVTAVGTGDILHISVREGPLTTIVAIRFQDPAEVPEAELRGVLTLVEGRPSPADLNGFGEDIYRMCGLYWDRAHLQVTIVPVLDIRPTDDPQRFEADVTYTIDSGPTFRVSQVTIAGNTTTDTDLLRRELTIGPGDLYSRRELAVSRQRLLGTALFRDVSITTAGWDSTAASTALEIRVTERRPAFWELGLGLGSRERMRAQIAWGHNNLWGTGQRLQLRLRGYWNVEEILGSPRSFDKGDLNYRGDVFYHNPHLLASRHPLEVNLFARRETRGESGLIQNLQGVVLGTLRQDGMRLLNRLDLSVRRVDPEVHPDAPDSLQDDFEAANITDTQTRSLVHSLFVDGRNDLFNPSRGYYLNLQEEVAGGLLGGDNSFVKVSGGYHRYQPLLGGTLATRVRLGGAWQYADSDNLGANGVPYDDRYFAGGTFSVRGYLDNSLGPQLSDRAELDAIGFGSDVPLPDNPARGGNYQLITNLEWRFPLPLLSRWSLSSVVFMDGGNVWESATDILLKGFRINSQPGDPGDPTSTKLWDYRYSIGTGLRLDTPFGPVRVDIGWPLKRARYQSLQKTVVDDPWRVHFSLGQTF